MHSFKNYHPIVNFIYFFAVISFSMASLNPLMLIIAFIGSVSLAFTLEGRKSAKLSLFYLFPFIAVAMLFNPLFNHKGETILLYFPSGNPLTLESIISGLATGLMLASVLSWFSSFNIIFTSDKFIYLFGKISPKLSLVLSMTLRFIPRFKAQFKETYSAQNTTNNQGKEKDFLKKLKQIIKVFSSVISQSFENAVDTSKSMKARGYGVKKRSSFSIFRFTKKDFWVCLIILLLGIYVLLGFMKGVFSFDFYPVIHSLSFNANNISYFIAYFVLCFIPVIIEILEVIRWRLLKQKI